MSHLVFFFFFQAEDGIRDLTVTGVQTCALPIYACGARGSDVGHPERSGQGALQRRLLPGSRGRRGRRGESDGETERRYEARSEEHTSELQSQSNLVCRLLLEKKKTHRTHTPPHR